MEGVEEMMQGSGDYASHRLSNKCPVLPWKPSPDRDYGASKGCRAGTDKEALFHTNLIPLCQYTDKASNGVCKRVKVNISEPWYFKSQGAFGNKANAGSASPSAEAEISGKGSWLCPLAEVAREETQ